MLLVASLFTGGAAKAAPATAEGQLASMLPMMLLYAPVSMLFWHAPALVHFHGVAPVKSLFFSLVACLRNWAALTVFGIGWVVVIIGVSLPLSVGVGLLGSPEAALPFVAPVLLALAAMFSTSIYFTFRDSFVAEPTDAPATEPV